MQSFNHTEQTSLFDEEPLRINKVVNVASVPQLSPFRYPGGKTWFVPVLRRWLYSRPDRIHLFIEPFGGGGICSLTVANENLAESVVLNELDEQVAAVWHTVLSKDNAWLIERILQFPFCKENVLEVFSTTPQSTRDLAFQTILKNRTLHGGIMAHGSGLIKNGEGGRGLASRWYPQTLARRISRISLLRERISFCQEDAFDVISRYDGCVNSTIFLDPPYTAGGKAAGRRLYSHSTIDHRQLFSSCAAGQPDPLFTYDNAPEVRELANEFGLETRTIPMKNTHHSVMDELVVGRSLDWL
jgi:DNA adenine methylase